MNMRKSIVKLSPRETLPGKLDEERKQSEKSASFVLFVAPHMIEGETRDFRLPR
jgi:hypothetical protein